MKFSQIMLEAFVSSSNYKLQCRFYNHTSYSNHLKRQNAKQKHFYF